MSLRTSSRLFSSCLTLRTSITSFSQRKQGTGAGPFVELPDLQPLHDSILLRIPSSSSITGKLDNITVVNSSNELKDVDMTKLFSVEKASTTNFVTLSTGDEPVNLICSASTRLSNVTVINLDDYEKGWTLVDPISNVFCYSGDVLLQGNRITGRGVFAVAGQGPSWQIKLESNEDLLIPSKSILGYSSTISTNWETRSRFISYSMPSWLSMPKEVIKWLDTNVTPHYNNLRLIYNKVFRKDKIMARVKGPGLVILQNQNSNRSKNVLYTDAELLKALEQ